jgi:division protein CdvB (Snf7/Vps24/ESCRT-III family)
MKDYQEVRNQLINMLEELDERLDKITDDIKHVDKPLEQDFSEQAVESENDQVLDALATQPEQKRNRLSKPFSE